MTLFFSSFEFWPKELWIHHPREGSFGFQVHIYTVIILYIYKYGKCLGFARNRNHDRRRIIIITIIIIIIKPLLKIFNECRSFTGVGELNPY